MSALTNLGVDIDSSPSKAHFVRKPVAPLIDHLDEIDPSEAGQVVKLKGMQNRLIYSTLVSLLSGCPRYRYRLVSIEVEEGRIEDT